MRGRNKSTKTLETVKHCCCSFNCTTSTQKQNNIERFPELANVRFFPFPQDNANKYYAAGMSERERHMRWIAPPVPCRDIYGLNVTRHTRICSIHFEGGHGLTKLNPVVPQYMHSHNIFSENLQKDAFFRGETSKSMKGNTVTTETSRNKKVFTSTEKKTQKKKQNKNKTLNQN